MTLNKKFLVSAEYSCNQNCSLNTSGCNTPNTTCNSSTGYQCRNPQCSDRTDCSCPASYWPTASISSNYSLVNPSDSVTFSGSFSDSNSNLDYGQIYITKRTTTTSLPVDTDVNNNAGNNYSCGSDGRNCFELTTPCTSSSSNCGSASDVNCKAGAYWCRIKYEDASGASGSTSVAWTAGSAGKYIATANAVDAGGLLCSGNPGVDYPYYGFRYCGAGSFVEVEVKNVCGAPTNSTPADAACLSADPSLTATWGSNANQMRFVVDDNSNFGSLSCDSTYTASNSYSCTLATGTYYWKAQNKATSCTGEPYSTTGNYSIDKSVPATPAGLSRSYDSGSTPGGTVTFGWTASSNPGCCTGPTYNITTAWTNSDGTAGTSTNSTTTATSSAVSCSGHDADTVTLTLSTAYDSCGNTSGNAALTTSYTCPAPVCPTPSVGSVTGCYGSDPSLSATINGTRANQLQFAVDDENTFASPWSCNSDWATATTYSCTLATGVYHWTARERQSNGTCTESAFAASQSYSIDKTAPTNSSQATASFTAIANPTPGFPGTITFSIPASTDADCANCSGKACSYFLQGAWYDPSGNQVASWPLNNGSWSPNNSPSTYTNPRYDISCSGKEGYTFKLLNRQAKDGVSPTPNATADLGNPSDAFGSATSYTCPVPDPSFTTSATNTGLKIMANNVDVPAGLSTGTYTRSGLRSTDKSLTSSQSAGNYYNSLTLTSFVQSNMTDTLRLDNVGLVGAAYANSATTPSDLATLKSRVDASNGFILLYANANIAMVGVGPAAGTADGQSGCATYNFCPGKYYVYFNGAWNRFTLTTDYRYPVGCNDGSTTGGTPCTFKVKAKVPPAIISPPRARVAAEAPTFDITLFKNLGSKKWKTYGYIENYYSGNEIMSSITPTAADP